MGAVRVSALPAVFTRRDAEGCGWSRGQIAWAIKSGRFIRLRRGVFCLRQTFETAEPSERHQLACIAALLSHDERHVLSHLSAAVTFGLPTPLGDLGRATLTLPGAPASTDRQHDLIVQSANMRPNDVVQWKVGRRTSVPRTVADCMRHLSVPDSVAIADAALHESLSTLTAIADVLQWQAGWPYAERAATAFRLVDARRESPLESRSFVILWLNGVPLPIPQVEVFDDAGLIGRVDGLWREHATVGEADGRGKYDPGDLAPAGLTPRESVEFRFDQARKRLIDEKIREDRLRNAGLEVVRWGTWNVGAGLSGLLRDLDRAFRRGDVRRVTARFRGL